TLDADADTHADANTADVVDAPPRVPTLPTAVAAELVATSPVSATTPASWNPHLPKFTGDDHFLYAVHTYFPNDEASRFALIMRRPRAGGPWVQVARVDHVHQPPGVAMDRGGTMHMVFDCLRSGTTDVSCF